MYERIIVPLDGSKLGEAALPVIVDLMSKMSAEVGVEITLLQVLSVSAPYVIGGWETGAVVYTNEEMEQTRAKAIDYLNTTAEILRNKGATVTSKVAIGEASEAIVKAAEEIGADLIAMSTHGRSGISRWAFGSVTERVLRRESSVPVIVVRAPKQAEKA